MRRLTWIVRRHSWNPVRVASFSSSSSSSSSSSASPSVPSKPSVAPGAPHVLRIGDVLTLTRRFTETDVARYSELSGDGNPVHLDDAFARDVGGFAGGRVVHGMLVASLFPSVIASHFPGAVYVSQTLKFKMPVYIDNEVRAQVQAIHLRQNKNRYIAKFVTQCFTGEESLVLDGEAIAVLPTLNHKED